MYIYWRPVTGTFDSVAKTNKQTNKQTKQNKKQNRRCQILAADLRYILGYAQVVYDCKYKSIFDWLIVWLYLLSLAFDRCR